MIETFIYYITIERLVKDADYIEDIRSCKEYNG